MVKQRLLIVSDDPAFYCPIKSALENDTAEIHCAESISTAVSCTTKAEYCLLMLDLQLPGMDKLEMIRILRLMKPIPIITMSDHLEANEIIDLYRSGADAYMEKPVDVRICAAQIKALIDLQLRTDEESQKQGTLAFGTSLVISPRYWQTTVDGEQINLTRKEYDLLLYLARHRRQVFSAQQLYEQVWSELCDLGCENTVTVHINILRKKLGTLGQKVIQMVRGFGYRFIPPQAHHRDL